VHSGLIDHDQRHGYRGPESRLPGKTSGLDAELSKQRTISGLEPAIVTQVRRWPAGADPHRRSARAWDSMKWARIPEHQQHGPNAQAAVRRGPGRGPDPRATPGRHVKFSQVPLAQGALVSLTRRTARSAPGRRLLLRAEQLQPRDQAKRQPGSSFKPFIYSAALDNGYTAASLVNDAPIVFVDEYLDKVWRPKNDTNTFLGPIRMREALYKSRNLVSIRLLQAMGVAKPSTTSPALASTSGPAAQPVPGPGHRDPDADGNRHRLEHLRQRRLQDHPVPDRQDRKPQRRHPVHRQPATRAEGGAATTACGTEPGHHHRADPGEAPTTQPAPQAPAVAERIVDGRTTYILNSMLEDVIKGHRPPPWPWARISRARPVPPTNPRTPGSPVTTPTT
jgi:penicillin-binding protein 1A